MSVAVDLEVAKAAVLLVVLTVVVEVVLLVVLDVVLTVLLLGDGILGCKAGCTDLPDARAFLPLVMVIHFSLVTAIQLLQFL